MKQRAVCMLSNELGDRSDGLNRTRFVVDEHHGHNDGALRQGFSHRIQIDSPITIDANNIQTKATRFEIFAGSQGRNVFGAYRDDLETISFAFLPQAIPSSQCSSFDRPV